VEEAEAAATEALAASQGTSEVHAASAASDLQVASRNMVTLGGSLVLTWGVALLVRFQLPRFLGPELFGAFNFSDAFSMAFFTFAELGIDTYIIREVTVRRKHASDFVGGVLVVRLALAALLLTAMYVVLLASGRPPAIRQAVLVFGVTQLAMINNSSLAALLQASTKVRRLAMANVLSKVLWGAGLALAISLGGSLPVLVLPLLVAELLKTAVLLPDLWAAAEVELRFDARATRLVLLAAVPFFINGVAVRFGGGLTVWMLEFTGTERRELGWYGAAANLSGLAMLLTPLISWVMMPLLARARERSEDEAYGILRRSIEVLMVGIVPVTMFLGVGAPEVVRLAFGARFLESAGALQVLAFDFAPMYIAIICSSMLLLTGRGWAVTSISLAAIPVRAVLLIPATRFCAAWLGEGGAAVGAAATEVAGITLTAGVSLWLCGRRAVDRRSLLALGRSLAVAVVVVALDRSLAFLGPWRLAIDVVAYTGLALAVKVATIADIRTLVALVRAGRKG
jgi:O-antigen/teichoic acid export membrane protein